ncbi:hypothetical protein [Enterobacter hormaechei]|uniref:hypothetical protein n=1 Tax=Enterobacter hormaechei TaxID=158836 RepID=UPI001239A0DC|nr:hypothetical protein [Enterobacter hormaechei]MDX7007707.1 hypothetical protein [Enterobacter hormaechei]VAE06262.1 Uncharacterised protein [Enterobacter hormaechei]
MTTRNIIQLIDIPDFIFTNQDPDINYADVADDCDSKTISTIEAIRHLSESIFSMSLEEEKDNEKIRNLSAIIYDLADLAIATNKISQTATYLSGVKDGTHGA